MFHSTEPLYWTSLYWTSVSPSSVINGQILFFIYKGLCLEVYRVKTEEEKAEFVLYWVYLISYGVWELKFWRAWVEKTCVTVYFTIIYLIIIIFFLENNHIIIIIMVY